MAKRILVCLSHAIEEFDQLKLLHSLGYEVASIGGYIDPAQPHDPKRPSLPEVPCYAEVKEAVDRIGADDNLAAAQSWIPDAILEWLREDGAIIFHHYLDQRLFPQWESLRDWRTAGGRVIWRTVGQSVEHNERLAQPYRADGLEVVRYSPKERNIPGFVGEDALIRFYKDEREWCGWDGVAERVINFTQHLAQRDPWTNYRFWVEATRGLTVEPMGPGSLDIGGLGEMSFGGMKQMLRDSRCYLYCGTQPASYTLGLVEALMTGIPVVSIGPSWMDAFPYGPELFEGDEFCEGSSDDPAAAARMLRRLLADHTYAAKWSSRQRERAIETFGIEVVGTAWRDFLGDPQLSKI